MKVMSYNTLFGGWDGEDNRRSLVQKDIIARERPDILIVQECKQFEANGHRRLHEVEESLGMRGFLTVSPHTGQHTAVFARWELKPVANEGDSVHFHHSATFVTLRVPGFTSPVTFASVHLCPAGPDVRLKEAAYLVTHAAPERLTLVAGDFNSVSPLDPEPDWSTLSPHFRARYFSPGSQSADRLVIRRLYDAGYIDIAHRLGSNSEPTVPGASFLNSEFVPFRSDYFLASASLAEKSVSYGVIRNELTDMASDHYPIVAEFRA